MGWLVISKIAGPPGWIVGILFFTQNMLGLIACHRVGQQISRSEAEILQHQSLLRRTTELLPPDFNKTSGMPIRLYLQTVGLMKLALIPIALVWLALPWVIKIFGIYTVLGGVE